MVGLLLVGLGDGVDVGFLLAGGLAAAAICALDDDVWPAAICSLVPLVALVGLVLATHLVHLPVKLETMLATGQLLRALMAAAIQQAQLLLDLLDAVLDLLGQVEVAKVDLADIHKHLVVLIVRLIRPQLVQRVLPMKLLWRLYGLRD